MPAVMTLAEGTRLSRQCRDILTLLQRGEQTNRDLAAVSLKYTSRISDLRASGFDIRVSARNHATGEVIYRLIPPGQQSLFDVA
jgi:hypothetical protein